MTPRNISRSVQALSILLLLPLTAQAQEVDLVAPKEIVWGAAPPSLPPGAQGVTLYGDASKEGLFAMRFKLPKAYQIPPHTHPKPEVVTVISGSVRLGMGEKADPGQAKLLPAGSFFALSPGMAHFLITEEESVVQLNSNGPWSITYLDPKDDPRRASQ